MKQASVVIRLGAAMNEVQVDGRTFDRSLMTREDRSKFNRLIVEAFKREQVR